jgi:sugar/nucleoside kinase (ribokinase family)
MKKVLGMGNALVDIMTKLENELLLKEFSLPKGSMQLVDKDFANKVNNGTKHLEKKQASGGSAANTIHGLSSLGVETAFLGKIGKDEFGEFFRLDMENNHIKTNLIIGVNETGKAIALVSPDSERTFATYLGAAVELSAEDILPSLFSGYSYFHIEGYLVQNYDLIKKAVKLAKENKLKVSLDLASFNVVEANLDFLKSILKEYVDIVFANEDEARAFTGKDPEESLQILSEYCEIAVVKTGEKGSLIKKGKEIHKIGIINANCIDTTGAGDLYAAGFLYGLTKDLSLNKCGEIGALLAGNVIEYVGAKIPADSWKEIKNKIKSKI